MEHTEEPKLVKYIREENGQPRGVVVALGRDKVGWSVCNPRDQFDKQLGRKIAVGRALEGSGTPIPRVGRKRDYVRETLNEMHERAQRYFK